MAFLQCTLVAVVGLILYPLSFVLMRRGAGDVLFYRGVIHALALACFQLALGFFVFNRGRFAKVVPSQGVRQLCAMTVASLVLSFNLTFLIVFPVTFDRSVTTYLLDELEDRGPLSVDQLEYLFMTDYVLGGGAIERRMQEQELSGNVYRKDGTVALTKQGDLFMAFSRFVRDLFGIPQHKRSNTELRSSSHPIDGLNKTEILKRLYGISDNLPAGGSTLAR